MGSKIGPFEVKRVLDSGHLIVKISKHGVHTTKLPTNEEEYESMRKTSDFTKKTFKELEDNTYMTKELEQGDMEGNNAQSQDQDHGTHTTDELVSELTLIEDTSKSKQNIMNQVHVKDTEECSSRNEVDSLSADEVNDKHNVISCGVGDDDYSLDDETAYDPERILSIGQRKHNNDMYMFLYDSEEETSNELKYMKCNEPLYVDDEIEFIPVNCVQGGLKHNYHKTVGTVMNIKSGKQDTIKVTSGRGVFTLHETHCIRRIGVFESGQIRKKNGKV